MLFQRDKNIWKLKMRTFMKKRNKKERKRSLNKKKSLFSPIDRPGLFSGKVSFYISLSRNRLKKASLVVETALVLPIFFLGLVTMISFMDIYKVQTEHLMELCENVKEAGMYAYVLNESGPEEITLPDVYAYTPVKGLISLPKVWMYNLITVHVWTGKTYGAAEEESEETEEMVYVTESGSVYHKDPGCSYLNISVNPVPGNAIEYLHNRQGNHYGACASCSKGQSPAAIVYITEQGENYHNEESCSALKRTVRMVKHSHADDLTACSRCGG